MYEIEHHGDPRHPKHGDFLRELGTAVFAAAGVAGIFSSALRELRLKSDPRRRHRHAADSTRHHGVEIGDAPGLGVTLDEAKVAEFAVKP